MYNDDAKFMEKAIENLSKAEIVVSAGLVEGDGCRCLDDLKKYRAGLNQAEMAELPKEAIEEADKAIEAIQKRMADRKAGPAPSTWTPKLMGRGMKKLIEAHLSSQGSGSRGSRGPSTAIDSSDSDDHESQTSQARRQKKQEDSGQGAGSLGVTAAALAASMADGRAEVRTVKRPEDRKKRPPKPALSNMEALIKANPGIVAEVTRRPQQIARPDGAYDDCVQGRAALAKDP